MFLGYQNDCDEDYEPTNEIERMALTTALDSIIWSNKDEISV